jgi:hypothetical protein
MTTTKGPGRMTLFDVEEKLALAVSGVDPDTGEVIEDDDERLAPIVARMLGAEADKVDRVAGFMLAVKGLADAAAEKKKLVAARQKRMETKFDNMARYSLEAMAMFDKRRMDGREHSLVMVNRPPSVVVYDGFVLPDEFCRIETVRTPNKDKIKAAIDAGLDVPGARIESGLVRLRID